MPIVDIFQLAAGKFYLLPFQARKGLYLVISGVATITVALSSSSIPIGVSFNFVGTSPSLTPVIGDAVLAVTRAANTATRVNASGLIAGVNANLPRFDYDPVALVSEGLLVEEESTNLFYPSDYSTVAGEGSPPTTVTPNVAVSPDGTTNAARVDGNATNNGVPFYFIATADVYNWSVWLKAGTSANVYVRIYDTVVGAFVASVTVQPTGTWARATVNSASALVAGRLYGAYVYSDPGSKSFYVWGGDLEVGAFPTSYIPTTSTAVTRNLDGVRCANISGFWNAIEGTQYLEFETAPGIGSANQYVASFDDGTANQRIEVYRNTSREIHCVVINGGVTQCDLNLGTLADSTIGKVAFAVEANSFSASLNGGAVVTDSAGTMPTVTVCNLGQDYAGANQLGGHERQIAYFSSRQADAILVDLSGGDFPNFGG
ncbi:MAG: phage head spike fiber domain-containing protein [Candidatus Acidiferrales bacterium]